MQETVSKMSLITNAGSRITLPITKKGQRFTLKDLILLCCKEEEYLRFLKTNCVNEYSHILISHRESGVTLNQVLESHIYNISAFIIPIREIRVNGVGSKSSRGVIKGNSYIMGILRIDRSQTTAISLLTNSKGNLAFLTINQFKQINNFLIGSRYDKGWRNIIEPTEEEIKKYEDNTDVFTALINQ